MLYAALKLIKTYRMCFQEITAEDLFSDLQDFYIYSMKIALKSAVCGTVFTNLPALIREINNSHVLFDDVHKSQK